MQTLAKCKLLYVDQRESGVLGQMGGEDVCSIWPTVARIHLVMSLGVVCLVNYP